MVNLDKALTTMIALIVIAYAAPTLVTSINALNLTDVGGTDLTFVVTLIGLVFFVGLAYSTWRATKTSGK